MRKLAVAMLLALATTTMAGQTNGTYDYYFMEAMRQRENENLTAAFDLLRHCATLKPDAPEVWFFLAQYYDAMKDTERALRYYQKATALDSKNTFYKEVLAQAYVDNKQNDKAIETLEDIARHDTGRDDILQGLMQLYQAKNDYKSMIKTLERLEVLEGKSEQISLQKSQIYTNMGDKKAAIAEAKALADQYPNDLSYRCIYAETLLVNGEEQKGLDVIHGVLAEEPANERALVSVRAYYKQHEMARQADSLTTMILTNKAVESTIKAYLLRQEIGESEEAGGDSTKVLAFFRQTNAGDKPDTDLLMMQAAYMNLKKMPGDSLAPIYRHVLAIAPDNSSARVELVQMAWNEGRMDSVVSLCQAARQYNPDEMVFYYFQGMAYYNEKDYDNALTTLQNGLSVINDQIRPEIVSDFYAVTGDLLYMKNRPQEAFAAYDSCLQWKPDNYGCMNNYAYYLSMMERDLDKAEAMSLKTVKAEPENPTYLDTYAWILFLKQRYTEAKIFIDKALANDSTASAVITEHAGDIYAATGDTDEAVELWKKALEKDRANKLLARKIKQRKYMKIKN